MASPDNRAAHAGHPGSPAGATTTDAPPSSTRRLPALDVLRGIAILGTLLTNIWIFSAAATDIDVTGQGGELPASQGGTGADNWVTASSAIIDNALNLVTDGKFIGLLTIMFGIGLEIQRQSAIRRGEKWPGRYPWRAGLLILDGLLNYIFIFEFDVLMGYGLTGLVVAAVMATSPKVSAAAPTPSAPAATGTRSRRAWTTSSAAAAKLPSCSPWAWASSSSARTSTAPACSRNAAHDCANGR